MSEHRKMVKHGKYQYRSGTKSDFISQNTKNMENENMVIDPIHKWIPFSDAEKKIIDSIYFQRLRGVRQLTCVHLVFPSAHHTRMEHSLGVMHLCGIYAQALYKDRDDCRKRVQIARISGLLHDVGHGPFSHSWDTSVYSKIYPQVHKGHDGKLRFI